MKVTNLVFPTRLLVTLSLLGALFLLIGCTATTDDWAGTLGMQNLAGLITPEAEAATSEEMSSPAQSVRILADRLNVRSEPSTEADVVAKLLVGNQVALVERSEDGEWLQVIIDDLAEPAWISAAFAEIIEPTPEPGDDQTDTDQNSTEELVLVPTPIVTPTSELTVPTAFTQPENMNIRGGPGTVYPVVSTAVQGSAFEINGISPDGEWYQVMGEGLEEPSWLFANLTDAGGPLDTVPTIPEEELPEAPEVPVGAPVAAASASAPPPSGGGFFGYGVQAHMLGGGIGEAIGATSNMGFNWIKQQIEWHRFEGSQGAVDFSELRRITDAAGGQGVSVLFSVVNAPEWAREPGFDPSVGGPPADPNTYAAFVGRLAGEFCGSSLKAIEVWNEQNLHYEWGNKPLNPAEYMNLLRAAYGSIKAACPSMLVISGALTPAGDAGALARDDFAYLEGMYQNGLAYVSDGIGAHPSGYNVPPSVTWQNACGVIQSTGNTFNGACDTPHHSWSFRSTMEGYRNIMLVYGDANKRVWPTEFGWAVGPAVNGAYAYANDNDQGEQAAWTVEAYTMMRNWGWVGPAFLWNLNFRVVADGTEKAQWGIVRNDYGPLPVYDALRNMPK